MASSKQKPRLSPNETRESLGSFNWNLAWRTITVTICGGTTMYFTAFALGLGVAPARMGDVTFVLYLTGIMQILAVPLLNRAQNKKRAVLSLALVEPVLLLAAVMVAPWLPGAWRLPVLLVTVFLAAATINMTQPFTDNWLSATIPAALRGRYLSVRTRIGSAVSIIVTFVASSIMAYLIDRRNPFHVAPILAVGAVAGLLAVIALGRATMPPQSAQTQVHYRDLLGVWQHRPFRRFFLFSVLYNLPFFFACPYYQVFNLEVAKLSPELIGLGLNGYCLVKLLTVGLMGRLVDRYGPRTVVAAVSPLYLLFFAVYGVAQPAFAWVLLLNWTMVGLADGAFVVASMKAMYEAIPETPSRPAFFAFSNLSIFLLFAVGSKAVVPVLLALSETQISFAGFTLGAFHLLYIACFVLLLPCLLSIVLLPPRAKPQPEGRGEE